MLIKAQTSPFQLVRNVWVCMRFPNRYIQSYAWERTASIARMYVHEIYWSNLMNENEATPRHVDCNPLIVLPINTLVISARPRPTSPPPPTSDWNMCWKIKVNSMGIRTLNTFIRILGIGHHIGNRTLAYLCEAQIRWTKHISYEYSAIARACLLNTLGRMHSIRIYALA